MKETLTSFGMTETMRSSSQRGPFNMAEHGIGMKLSSLRLGNTSLIVTKTNPCNQTGIQYLTVGLISVEFHRDTSEEHLVVPLICYQVKNKEAFLPLTPSTTQVFNLMKKYVQPLFASE